jgi:hypothetical protein
MSGGKKEKDWFRRALEKKLWAYGDLNARPLDYESSALTGLSYRPVLGKIGWDNIRGAGI